MVDLSVASISVPGILPDKLKIIADCGFKGVDLFERDVIGFDGTPEDLVALAADLGLTINSLYPFRDFEGRTGANRDRAFARLDAKLDLARRLGAGTLVVWSSESPEGIQDHRGLAGDLRAAGERAAERGLRIAYQALAWGRHVRTDAQAMDLIARADHPQVGLALNSFQTLLGDGGVETLAGLPADRVFTVQLSDAPDLDMGPRLKWLHYRCFPGLGDLDIAAFVGAVAATGYAGPWSVEVFNDKLREAAARSVATSCYRAVTSLLDQAGRAGGGTGLSTDAMPDRVGVDGVAFVEFTAGTQDVEPLSAVLGQMGFQRSAKHINKRVEIWKHGAARVVLNTETTGYAHAAYLTHGTSVCDIGLSVADAEAAMRRAAALGAPVFRQAVGPRELEIPAIRGVGGSVLHFVDQGPELSNVWTIEFNAEQERPERRTSGILGFDHLAQPMSFEEMESWALFYLATFRVDKTPIVDVADPAGLIHSQAIEGSDNGTGGGFRLNLNGVDTHRTNTGAFLAEKFGAPVQHIAFACADIFAFSSRLADAGFPRLEIAANYYDDLAATFGLDAALVDSLRAANMLYDRDGDGEYFQIYSQPLFGGFFFEVVERRGGYAGYGARNAAVRLAALKRYEVPPEWQCL